MAALSTLYSLIRPFVRNCPDVILDQWIIESARNFCTESRFLRESVLVPVNAGIDFAALVAPVAETEVVGIFAAEYDGYPLTPSSPEESKTREGTPLVFWYSPRSEIVMNPVPTETVADKLLVRLILQPLLAATTLPDALLIEARQAIAHGACARLVAMPGAGWANPQMIPYHEAKERDGIVSARVKADMEHRHREFNTGPGEF